MDRAYDINNKNQATRDKVRFLIDRIDNEEDRENNYNQVTVPMPKELQPGYLSNPAGRGIDEKDLKLNYLNTSRYRKANDSFFNTDVLPLQNQTVSKMFFNPRLMF